MMSEMLCMAADSMIITFTVLISHKELLKKS